MGRDLEQMSPNAWSKTYSYAKGAYANTFIVRHAGELTVVSPGTRMTKEDFDAVDELGTVSALIPPNGFHHLGIPDWKERYPDAKVYAEGKAKRRVEKKHNESFEISLLDKLSLPDHIVVQSPSIKMRIPDLTVRVGEEGGTTWYVNDLLMNMQNAPKGMIGFVMKASNSAPGLRFMNLAPTLLGASKKGLKRWLREGFEEHRPVAFVPGHGATIAEDSVSKQLGEAVA